MKAILVLDKMPKSCKECRLCYNGIDCVINGWVVFADEGQTNRSSRCPLKPLQEKLDSTLIALQRGEYEVSAELFYQVEGYNRCIERILGEEE